MFEIYLALTAIVLAVATTRAYRKTRDVLHPLMFLGPLFLYGTVLDPWSVRHDLDRFFPNPEDVNVVLLLNLMAVIAMAIGVLWVNPAPFRRHLQRKWKGSTTGKTLTMRRLALSLSLWANATYAYGIVNVGGFVQAFSRAKGGGSAGSGYISEAMNLGLVAAVMVALSRYRSGWTAQTLALTVLSLVPNVIQGTFGGRRGPLFLALATAMLAWFITRRRTPRLAVLWPALAAAAVAVVFVASQRQFLYLGSGGQVNWEEFTRVLQAKDVDEGNNFVYGAGFVLTVREAEQYTWGREMAVNLLIRPIPRQIWPTKYEDVGATWVRSEYPGLGHVSEGDWLSTVGWLPLAGSSAISISDVFGEFGWGTVAVFFLIGRGFGELYLRRRRLGGMWELLYLEALILSIYLATQSFSAFYHRYLILAVPTVIVWKRFLAPRFRATRRSTRIAYRPLPARPTAV